MIEALRLLPGELAVNPAAPIGTATAFVPDFAPRGLREMVEGRFAFVHDLERPGMLHARVLRPPTSRARLAELPQALCARLTGEGLHLVREGAFVALAGPREWLVQRAMQRLSQAARWELEAPLETGDIFQIMAAREAQLFAVINGKPEPGAPVAPAPAAPAYAARHDRPYTLHGALAPSAALAEWGQGKLHVICHSQGIHPLRDSIADSLGLSPQLVEIEHMPGSGCYGHNGADDAAFEAALIARALPDRPILLKYTREDEHGREPAAPAMSVRVAADVDAAGGLSRLWMEARGDTHRGRPRFGPNRAGPARLAANALRGADVPRFVPGPNMNAHGGLHRNLDPIYRVPEAALVKALVPDLPLRTSALRCLGAVTNVFALEVMMDELAHRAGEDPLAYRRRHLDDPRAIALIDGLAAHLATRPLPSAAAGGGSFGRGVAYAQYKNAQARVALAADLVVEDSGTVDLRALTLFADAGRIVDPEGLRAQLEGGALQGASWALFEQLRWGPESRESLDWESYPVLRFDAVPEIEVVLLDQPGAPSLGAGEASPGPAVAAIANAIHAASGLRLHRMPFDRDAILAAALAE